MQFRRVLNVSMSLASNVSRKICGEYAEDLYTDFRHLANCLHWAKATSFSFNMGKSETTLSWRSKL